MNAERQLPSWKFIIWKLLILKVKKARKFHRNLQVLIKNGIKMKLRKITKKKSLTISLIKIKRKIGKHESKEINFSNRDECQKNKQKHSSKESFSVSFHIRALSTALWLMNYRENHFFAISRSINANTCYIAAASTTTGNKIKIKWNEEKKIFQLNGFVFLLATK